MTLSEKAALEATMRELELVENEAHKSADLRIRRQWHEVCSQLQQRLDRDDDAIQHARAALESVGEGDFGTQHRNQARLVQLLVNAGQLQDAESVLRKSLADKESKIGGDDIITNYARADLAEFLVQLKSYAEAEELLQQAQKYLLTDVRVPVLQRERVAGVLAKLYDAWGKPERASIWRAKLDNRPASEPNSPEEISASGK